MSNQTDQTPPKPQYPWDEIPPECEWAATDFSGFRYAYEVEPEPQIDILGWSADGEFFFFGRVTYPCLEWRESLERRPE